MKRAYLLIALLILTSCTADHVDISTCVTGKADGFLMGFWHGMIAPITFIISLFSNSVEMYSINNTGGWYNLGFVLGAGIITFGSSKAKK